MLLLHADGSPLAQFLFTSLFHRVVVAIGVPPNCFTAHSFSMETAAAVIGCLMRKCVKYGFGSPLSSVIIYSHTPGHRTGRLVEFHNTVESTGNDHNINSFFSSSNSGRTKVCKHLDHKSQPLFFWPNILQLWGMAHSLALTTFPQSNGSAAGECYGTS